MRLRTLPLLSLIVGLATVVAVARTQGDPLAALRQSFLAPPPDSRIMMRWWWFGPSVTKPELARELETMKAGGIGGVEIQPVYPLEPDDETRGIKNLPFLSDEFLDAVRFANVTARQLGLRVDLTLGSGWPYGGPTVGVDHAVGKLRVERVKTGAMAPPVGPGEKLITQLPAPDGSGDTLVFISSRTGMMVKRAALGAEGYVLDHYDRRALDSYLDLVGGRLLRAFEGAPPYAIFCDSLEVFESDWTPDFLDAFKAKRGYDLTPHLPELVRGTSQTDAALRHDWGQTLTELAGERFVTPLQDWARAHQTKLRMQGYGMPPVTISSVTGVDLPEGEGAQWTGLSSTRWASSISHLSGVPVTSSETWTWLHSPVFRASPLDMKAEADRHFLQGINQLIGHGWPYTPPGVEEPGWRFYAAAVFNEHNPWWIAMPDVALYLQRVSFMLRQGTPVTDVALYVPVDDAWASFSPGRVHLNETLRERIGPDTIPHILGAGFSFDLVDDGALAAPRPYRAIVVPGVERMSLTTLQRLEQFARGGGVVIATRRVPSLAPGFTATAEDHAQIRGAARRLFEDPGAPGHFVRDEAGGLATTLQRLLQPDVLIAPAAPPVGFTHRRTDEADIYFLANTGNTSRSFTALFRVDGTIAEDWDPMTGRTTQLPVSRGKAVSAPYVNVPTLSKGLGSVFYLEPYASRVLVFPRRGRSAAAAPPVERDPSPLTLRDWKVTFHPGPSVTIHEFRSWTENEATKYFSGVATYEREVVVPDKLARRPVSLDMRGGDGVPEQPLRAGMQAWFNAPVREAAVVYVNDKRIGSVWCPPYAIDLTGALTEGSNRIRIEVANLAVNAMAGKPLPNYRLLNLRYGTRFEAQDMDKVQPVPAGLLSVIQLVWR